MYYGLLLPHTRDQTKGSSGLLKRCVEGELVGSEHDQGDNDHDHEGD